MFEIKVAEEKVDELIDSSIRISIFKDGLFCESWMIHQIHHTFLLPNIPATQFTVPYTTKIWQLCLFYQVLVAKNSI